MKPSIFKNKSELLCILQGIGLIIFFSLTFLLKSGYSYGAAFLFLCGIFAVCSPNTFKLSRYTKIWIIFILISIGLMTFVRFIHQESSNEYDMIIRYLLSLSFLFGFTRYRPSVKFYVTGLFMGCLSALCVIIWVRVQYGLPSQIGYQHRINFCDISMIMAVMAGFAALLFRTGSLWNWLCIVSAIFGIITAGLGGARGSWIMLPPVLLLFIAAMYKKIYFKYLISGLLGLFTIVAALYFVPQTKIAERVHSVFSDIQSYEKGDVATSQGMRLEMWQFGFYLIKEKPLLGWGSVEMLEYKEILSKNGTFDASISSFNQLHNDYIDTMARFGLIGFLALFILYFGPLVIYVSILIDSHALNESRIMAWSGVAVTVCFIIGSLTNGFMRHNIANIFYPLLQAWLITGLHKNRSLSN